MAASEISKTSLRIDHRKVAEAQRLLGTGTLVDTVDAALQQVVDLGRRRRVMERIRKTGGLGPEPKELRRLRNP